jgi:hypothetical protein
MKELSPQDCKEVGAGSMAQEMDTGAQEGVGSVNPLRGLIEISINLEAGSGASVQVCKKK